MNIFFCANTNKENSGIPQFTGKWLSRNTVYNFRGKETLIINLFRLKGEFIFINHSFIVPSGVTFHLPTFVFSCFSKEGIKGRHHRTIYKIVIMDIRVAQNNHIRLTVTHTTMIGKITAVFIFQTLIQFL